MAFGTKRLDEAASGETINLVEKYGPIGPSAVRAAVSIAPKKQCRDIERDKLDRLLAPEHLPER